MFRRGVSFRAFPKPFFCRYVCRSCFPYPSMNHRFGSRLGIPGLHTTLHHRLGQRKVPTFQADLHHDPGRRANQRPRSRSHDTHAPKENHAKSDVQKKHRCPDVSCKSLHLNHFKPKTLPMIIVFRVEITKTSKTYYKNQENPGIG